MKCPAPALPHSSSDRPTSSSIHPSCTLPIRFSLLLVHPSSRDTLVRRPQLMHFRPFRHMHSTLPLYLISWCSSSSSHHTLNARANPRVCFIGGRRHHPSGFGRPPPLPAMSRCPPGPRESAPSADVVWPRTNAQRMIAGSARTYAPRYAHLNMPFALPKIDLFRCVPRPTSSSWRRSPWVSMAALRFDRAPPW